MHLVYNSSSQNEGDLSVGRVVVVIDAGYGISPHGMKAQMESGVIHRLCAVLYDAK